MSWAHTPQNAGHIWTEERFERAKAMWVNGISASQIAKHLGGVSRNAVIGKLYRAQLAGSKAPSREASAPGAVRVTVPRPPRAKSEGIGARPPQASKAPKPPKPEAVSAERLAPAFALVQGAKPLADCVAHECVWPVGEPPEGEVQLFCGAPAEDTYCTAHAALAGRRYDKARKPASVADFERSLRRYFNG